MSDTYQPTPTQAENDQAKIGESQVIKERDGSPEQGERPAVRQMSASTGYETFRPTPTQGEVDRTVGGEAQSVHLPDGSEELPPHASVQPPNPPEPEPELNFRTRMLEPERERGSYRTRSQRRAEEDQAADDR